MLSISPINQNINSYPVGKTSFKGGMNGLITKKLPPKSVIDNTNCKKNFTPEMIKEGIKDNFKILSDLKDKILQLNKQNKKPDSPVTETVAKESSVVSKPKSFGNLKKQLKRYMENLNTNDNVNPQEIERILLDAGAQDVTEKEGIRFVATNKFPIGKKKKFLFGNKSFILETHGTRGVDDSKGMITRLYEEGEKDKRNYLTKHGTFAIDSYFSAVTHLFSGLKGLDWINASI